jgi:hypothetical protein
MLPKPGEIPPGWVRFIRMETRGTNRASKSAPFVFLGIEVWPDIFPFVGLPAGFHDDSGFCMIERGGAA